MYAELTLEIEEVVALVGTCKRTIERLVARGQFPAPFYMGTCRKWRRRDIELFVEAGSIHAFRRAKRGD